MGLNNLDKSKCNLAFKTYFRFMKMSADYCQKPDECEKKSSQKMLSPLQSLFISYFQIKFTIPNLLGD